VGDLIHANEARRRERRVVLLLMAAYTVNSMDRSIVSIVGQSMKVDLGLSDTQLGLLGGTAFAVLYAFGGIPAGRLAERVNRVNLLSVALLLWSSLTVLCAMAASFTQLLLIRVGIGVAESGCSPPSHSLISDYVEPARRASALSVYTCGISLGYILVAVVGGYVTQHLGWRAACVAVGLPGIAVAVLIKALIEEPARGASERKPDGGVGATSAPLPRFSLRAEITELSHVARTLLAEARYLHVIIGLTLQAFAAYGLYAFMPLYLRRSFGLEYSTVGWLSAAAGGVAVGIGILAGGYLADRLNRRRGASGESRQTRWYALVPALGGAISLPLYVMALWDRDWIRATLWLAAAGFFQYTCLGPTFGVVQNAVPPQRRATATALLYICLNVVALGGGPLFAGWAIDRAAESQFQSAAVASAANPAASTSVVGAASFHQQCPGGSAPPGAGSDLQARCQSALATGTQRGLLLTLAFFAWAALHYFLAARRMSAPPASGPG
jgi:predicted MFS family arabinose efflux permease